MLSPIEKSLIHLYKRLAIVLVLVAMTTDFEHKLNHADKLYKPVKFQANSA